MVVGGAAGVIRGDHFIVVGSIDFGHKPCDGVDFVGRESGVGCGEVLG
jgi:hypothetical protein